MFDIMTLITATILISGIIAAIVSNDGHGNVG